MKILVTGASGFIGSRLVAQLAAEHDIWALCHKQAGTPSPRVRWLHHDFSTGVLPPGLPERADAVIHLAQSPHYRGFPDHAGHVFSVGAGSTVLLLDWARRVGVRQFILASTGGLHGGSDQPLQESGAPVETPGPLGFYYAVKHSSEVCAAQYAGYFSVAVLRFFFVYGTGQRSSMLLPRLVTAVRDGRPILLHGEDGIRINPVHVSDAVQAVARCLTLTGRHVMNIAGPTVLSLRRIGELIGQQVGHLPVFTADRSARPQHLVADISRMSALLGAPAVDLPHGLAELCRATAQE